MLNKKNKIASYYRFIEEWWDKRCQIPVCHSAEHVLITILQFASYKYTQTTQTKPNMYVFPSHVTSRENPLSGPQRH